MADLATQVFPAASPMTAAASPPLARRAIVSPDVLSQTVDGQAVLLHMTDEMYHSLDEIGTHVWDALREDGDVDRLVARMLAAYEVDESTLRADLAALLASLADAKLVTLEP